LPNNSFLKQTISFPDVSSIPKDSLFDIAQFIINQSLVKNKPLEISYNGEIITSQEILAIIFQDLHKRNEWQGAPQGKLNLRQH